MQCAPFTISAVIPAGKHLFPFRTEKLSLPGPMVLRGQPPGRVGRRRFNFAEPAPLARAPRVSGGSALHFPPKDLDGGARARVHLAIVTGACCFDGIAAAAGGSPASCGASSFG